MAEHLRVINQNSEAPPEDDVLTETSRDIIRSLQHAKEDNGSLTMIAGVPGSGKSHTVRRYCELNDWSPIWHTAVAGEGKIWDLAVSLMDMLDLGKPNSATMRENRFQIAEAIGPERLVIIDEAQYLSNYNPRGANNFDAFEWLRALAEEGAFSVAFVGDMALVEAINSVPQLRRRVIRPVVISKVLKSDVVDVAHSFGVRDANMHAALAAVARRYGGLGDVVNVIKHARKFAGSHHVALDHLSAAIHDLKLDGAL